MGASKPCHAATIFVDKARLGASHVWMQCTYFSWRVIISSGESSGDV